MTLSRTFTELPDSKYVVGLGVPRVRAEVGDPGFVYFIQGEGGGPIKIGWTIEPYERLKTLQTAAPFKLFLLGVVIGSKKDEAKLHRKLAKHRLTGEWFNDHSEVRRAMHGSALPVEPGPLTFQGERCLNCSTLLVHGEDHLCKACIEFMEEWATPEFKAAWCEYRGLADAA